MAQFCHIPFCCNAWLGKGVHSVQMRGNAMLLLAAFIWGTTFVAQMVGMDELGPFSYAAARFFLGMLFLLGLWYAVRGRRADKKQAGTYMPGWRAGCGAGLIMFCASSTQQVAMVYTTVGKTAFITALYIVLVPLAGHFLLRQRIALWNWLGAGLALVGLYFLSIHGAVELNTGDAILMVSALFWTAHILFVGHFAGLSDVIEMSLMQIAVCFVGSAVAALLVEMPALTPMLHAWFPIFYGGVMSAGVAFTLQIVGQRYTQPATASLLMSFEAVFGVLSSWLILGEVMSPAQVLGCTLMFAGILVTQAGPWLRRKNR